MTNELHGICLFFYNSILGSRFLMYYLMNLDKACLETQRTKILDKKVSTKQSKEQILTYAITSSCIIISSPRRGSECGGWVC